MTKTKICTKCKEEISITEFGANKANKNGLKSWCRACGNKASKTYRDNNKEKTRAADVKRNQTAARKASHNIHAATYRKKHEKIHKAHNAVASALRSGKLIKPDTCCECGSDNKLEGHHMDYDRVLDVKFVCIPCHNLEPEAINRY